MIISIKDNSFLFEVYVNDFNDNYHKENEPSNELERLAKKIRRRYRVMSDYMNAMIIYEDYMNVLAVKHGGRDSLQIKIDSGVMDDFIPAKPRMRNTVTNKYLIKNKIIISNVKNRMIDEDGIELLTNNIDKVNDIKLVVYDDIFVSKILKDGIINLSDKRLKSIQTLDLLSNFIEAREKLKKSKVKEYYPSLRDVMSGDYINKIKDTTEEDETIFHHGKFMRRGDVEELSTYQTLNNLGWNSVKVMKDKGINKKITKIVSKKNKLEKKKNKKGAKNDNFMTRVLTDNKYNSFEDFQKDMLDFTSDKD